MNRIENRMNQLEKEGKKAFITYVTAGLPDFEGSKKIIKAQYEAGVDVVELGIPFSDPVADGPVIQTASYKAIQKGVNLRKIFKMVEELRSECEVPIVFMMYYNTILYYGIDKFVKECARVGVDGLVIPDLPFEEQHDLKESILSIENAPYIIQLVSPVSKDRIPMILENAKGFVYCVSSMGVTGQDTDFYGGISQYLKDVKKSAKIPVMMGFGIKTAKDVEPFKNDIDGAIVGSHFINILEESDYSEKIASDYVKKFKMELN